MSAGDAKQAPAECESLPCRVSDHEVHREQEEGGAHQDGGELSQCDEAELHHRVGPQ